MKLQNKSRRTVQLAISLTYFAAVLAAADETVEDEAAQRAQELAQLQYNIHEMRRAFDGDRAQRQAARRGNARPLIIDSRDAPGIGTMRAELSQSLDRLASRCFGNEIDADGGNVILICGDNAGSAESANVTNAAYTTVVVEPLPEEESDAVDASDPVDAPADTIDAGVQP